MCQFGSKRVFNDNIWIQWCKIVSVTTITSKWEYNKNNKLHICFHLCSFCAFISSILWCLCSALLWFKRCTSSDGFMNIFFLIFCPFVWFSPYIRFLSLKISDIFHKTNCSFRHIIIITFVNGHASESSGSSAIKHSHDYSFLQFCDGVRRWRAQDAIFLVFCFNLVEKVYFCSSLSLCCRFFS